MSFLQRATSTQTTIAFLIAGVLVLYAPALTFSPPYLHEAEVLFALHAHAIATSAHDLYGRFLPLYFQMQPIGENVWFQPAIVYTTALFLKVLPFSEWTIRLPSVVVGALDVVLLYLIARRIFPRHWLAVVAAVGLALSPAHFINSRIAMDYVYPIPFVLGWLLCLLVYLEQRRERLLFAGGSLLGLGVYSYIASVVMMPLYLAITWLIVWRTADKPARACLVTAAGFAWPLLILPVWLWRHPEMLAQTLSRYRVGDQPVLSGFRPRPLQILLEELRQSARFSGLTGRISLYWYFFDPSYLFLTGGYANIVNLPRHVSVFLVSFIVLLPLGIWRVASQIRQPANLLVLLGFFSAPFAACLIVPEPYAIDREMALVPFGALLATWGVATMWDWGSRWRTAARVLMVAAVCHFAFVLVDYYGDYRRVSSFWFNKNHRGAFEEILAEQARRSPAAIYLSRGSDPFMASYWRLSLIEHGEEALLDRTVYFSDGSFDIAAVPAGSLVLCTADDKRVKALARDGRLRQRASIAELADPPYFEVLER